MKKHARIIGGILSALLVAGGIVLSLSIRLSGEAAAYAEAAILPIVMTWDPRELEERATPELLARATPEERVQLFHWFSKLGAPTQFRKGNVFVVAWFTTARGAGGYLVKADFEGGKASVTAQLLKRDGQWRIHGFAVYSDALTDKPKPRL